MAGTNTSNQDTQLPLYNQPGTSPNQLNISSEEEQENRKKESGCSHCCCISFACLGSIAAFIITLGMGIGFVVAGAILVKEHETGANDSNARFGGGIFMITFGGLALLSQLHQCCGGAKR